MKIGWLVLAALCLAIRAGAAPQAPAAADILEQDRFLLLGGMQDWKDFLATAAEESRDKHLPPLVELKEAAASAASIEALRPLELRFDAWKKNLMADMFPNAAAPQTDQTVELARAQVDAFGMVKQKLGTSSLNRKDVGSIAKLKAQISSAPDPATLDRIFDRLGWRRPATAVSFNQAFSGSSPIQFSASRSAYGPDQGLKINDVPSPLSMTPAEQASYAPVVSALRSQGFKKETVDMVIAEAIRQRVDPLLVLAVVRQESMFHSGATSRVGARGLMQIMPATGKGLGISNPDRLYDPRTNIEAGVRFLKQLWRQFADVSFDQLSLIDPFSQAGVKKAIAAYNAGPGAVRKYDAVPPYRETQGYVVKVLSYYKQLRQVWQKEAIA